MRFEAFFLAKNGDFGDGRLHIGIVKGAEMEFYPGQLRNLAGTYSGYGTTGPKLCRFVE